MGRSGLSGPTFPKVVAIPAEDRLPPLNGQSLCLPPAAVIPHTVVAWPSQPVSSSFARFTGSSRAQMPGNASNMIICRDGRAGPRSASPGREDQEPALSEPHLHNLTAALAWGLRPPQVSLAQQGGMWQGKSRQAFVSHTDFSYSELFFFFFFFKQYFLGPSFS